MKLPEKLAFVDIETTGTSFGRDRIIEIGILRIENNQLVQTYESLINPQVYLSPYIEMMTGIKSHALENAPLFKNLTTPILETLEDCVFVSHNVSFDYGFLKSEFARLGLKFNFKKFCTVKLSRRLFPEQTSHGLDAVIARHNIACKNRHRAFDDAKVLWDFYRQLQTQFESEILADAIWGSLKYPTYPIAIAPEKLDNLPEGPGVYIFYAEGGMPLYVGKSINIRSRVLSHFCDVTSSREVQMCKQTVHIDTIPTAGELGALIREAQLIKSLLPLYNRALRRNKRMLVLLKQPTEYTQTLLTEASKLTAADTQNVLGIFKSKRQAQNFLHQTAKEHFLCPKLLGLEKVKSRCSFHQFGWCKGACTQEEAAAAYNTRLIQAFDKERILPWPFASKITIREQSKINNLEEEILFDQWCHVELQNKDDNPENIIFDKDIYKILRRYLRSAKARRSIQTHLPL